MNVLHVCANPKPTEESVSKQLATVFFERLVELYPDVELNNVDLYQDPPPYFDYPAFRAIWHPMLKPGYQPTSDEKQAAAYAVRHAEIFNRADVLVLTLPMWNFGMPAILKAWLDQVLAPNLTFTYQQQEDGSAVLRPLHRIRKLVMLVSSGGIYREGDPNDALTSGLEAIFGFIGVDDITIVWADGQNPFFYSEEEMRNRRAVAEEAAREAAEEIAEAAMAETGTGG